MYKDKDKQRDADRERQRHYRAKRDKHGVTKGVTDRRKGVTESGCDIKGVTERTGVNLDALGLALAPNSIGGIKLVVKPKPERTAQGNIRVSKPGDDDYEPQCETTRAFIEGRPKRPEIGKRGKDIKCFTDLPLDVQETIDRMSTTDGRIDQRIKEKRTAAAIRYHSTGVA